MVGFELEFLTRHQLPESYLIAAQQHFDPVAQRIIEQKKRAGRPYIVALNGCQGSGKSTLADYLKCYFEAQSLRAVAISLDDFYLTQGERQDLAETVHPLLKTRGVPGTHNTEFMKEVILSLYEERTPISVPRFNKAIDDRAPESEWTVISEPVDIIILEGWFWGAKHQMPEQLEDPINDLEQDEDPHAHWRTFVNEALKSQYQPIYALMDCWLMLKAPSFDCVYQWRLEQEQKLSDQKSMQSDTDLSGIMSASEIKRFIQYYQRITEHLLITLPERADVVWRLSADRNIQACLSRNTFSHLEGELV